MVTSKASTHIDQRYSHDKDLLLGLWTLKQPAKRMTSSLRDVPGTRAPPCSQTCSCNFQLLARLGASIHIVWGLSKSTEWRHGSQVPWKFMIRLVRLVVLIPRAIMEWSKRPGKGDRERKIWSRRVAHFWPFPSQGCWVSLGIGKSVYKPWQGFHFGVWLQSL